MSCPQCGTENPAQALHCVKCGAELPAPGAAAAAAFSEVTQTTGAASGWSDTAQPAGASAALAAIAPGKVLGNRYEIIQLLGEGGMGAVYKVRDREVDRFVALKMIRPELAGRAEFLRRFKQELILARQVTHKNVIRIFDLGEADGLKFITMDFIEGRDLRSQIKQQGKYPPEEAVKIIAQVCRALEAAHDEGVVHRDLKPHNILLDANGRVVVMDFGIARSLAETGGATLTQTGALMGTPQYMSPEQAKGEEVDARSDLFTLGIIFYELLTGETPYHADTALGTLLKRIQERPKPPVELDATIPPEINDVVMRCLEIDRERRYQSAREILEDLGQEARTGTDAGQRPLTAATASATAAAAAATAPVALPLWQQYWKAIAAAALAVVLLALGVLFRGRLFPGGGKGATGPSISLAILPFHNASGDASLDWLGASLAEMLRTDVGESSSLRSVSPDRLHQILTDLRISSDAELDPATIHRVAEFTNADRLVWGQYVKIGDQIRIDATLEDVKRQRATPLKAEAPNDRELLHTVDQLARAIQENLTLAPQAVKEMQASAFTPTSNSVEALRDYTQGLQLARQGNHIEARKDFEAATKADPSFALAFSAMAQASAALGYGKEAEQQSNQAVDLSANLPPAEKYLIQGANARILNNYDKAIEAYENLSKILPNDAQVQFDLASIYETQGAFDQAHDHFARVLEADPKYVDALLAVGRVEIKRGTPQGSFDSLNKALSLAVQLDNQQGKANVLQALGVAYRLLNKPEDALRNYQESLAIKRQIGDKRGMAVSLDEIAQINEGAGKPDEARKNYEAALQVQREIGDKKGIGLTLMNLGDLLRNRGQSEEALKATKEALQIHLELGDEDFQALCLNNIGAIYFQKGQYDDALTYFQRALQIREKLKVPDDIASAVNNLGETSAKMGRYDQALSQYLRALELWRSAGNKTGVAQASDGMATLFEYQGRYGAASDSAAEALKTLQQLQDRSASMAEIQADYAEALILVGRGDQAQKGLEDALSLARSLQNNALVAKILNFQGDRFFYAGDWKAARPLFEQAQQAAAKAADRGQVLIARFSLAKVAVKEGPAAAAAGTLRALGRDADSLGLKFLSAECSVYLGEALLAQKDYPRARQELENAVRKSDDLGMRALLPQAHFLLAQALRGAGQKSEAERHLQEAARRVEEMRKESKSDALVKRADLRPIAEAASLPSR